MSWNPKKGREKAQCTSGMPKHTHTHTHKHTHTHTCTHDTHIQAHTQTLYLLTAGPAHSHTCKVHHVVLLLSQRAERNGALAFVFRERKGDDFAWVCVLLKSVLRARVGYARR